MTPEEEKDLLLGVVTRLVQTQLEEQGGFVTLGATLGSKRNVRLLVPKSMKQNATRDELESYWLKELGKVVTDGECRAACYCAHILLPRTGGEVVEAVFVHLEHAEAQAEDILYPYRRDEASRVILGKPTRGEVDRQMLK